MDCSRDLAAPAGPPPLTCTSWRVRPRAREPGPPRPQHGPRPELFPTGRDAVLGKSSRLSCVVSTRLFHAWIQSRSLSTPHPLGCAQGPHPRVM